MRLITGQPGHPAPQRARQPADGRVLLGHTAGDWRRGHLDTVQITAFPVKWLYKPTDQGNAD